MDLHCRDASLEGVTGDRMSSPIVTNESRRQEALARRRNRKVNVTPQFWMHDVSLDLLENVFIHIEARLVALQSDVQNHKRRQQQRWLGRWQSVINGEIMRRRHD